MSDEQQSEKPKPPRRRIRAATPPVVQQPETLTVEQRLAATKAKARELAKEQKIRIPLRLPVPLELHESLVEIAKVIGGKVPDAALDCMERGAAQFRIKGPVAVKEPPRAWAQGPAGVNGNDAERARQAMEVAVQESSEVERARDAIAEQLHLPGRRRASTG